MNNNRSLAALLKFMDYLRDKGLMKPATVSARKASANKVLSVLPSEELTDVTALDIEHVMERFSNLEGQNYTPDSLAVYKSRTKAAIEDFTSYLNNPMGFRPALSNRSGKKKTSSIAKPATNETKTRPDTKTASLISPIHHDVSILPIQIRSDLIVRIQGLPFDLTTAEANKLSAIIQAHAVSD